MAATALAAILCAVCATIMYHSNDVNLKFCRDCTRPHPESSYTLLGGGGGGGMYSWLLQVHTVISQIYCVLLFSVLSVHLFHT